MVNGTKLGRYGGGGCEKKGAVKQLRGRVRGQVSHQPFKNPEYAPDMHL